MTIEPQLVPALSRTHGETRRLIPLVEWNAYHSWPPLGGLRYLVFHSASNGFHRVVRKIGRRVLIDESAFFNWVEAQQGGGTK